MKDTSDIAICRVFGDTIEKPDVSIIVPMFRSVNDIKEQIRSWPSNNDGIKTEIIYVDDNCPDQSKSSVFKTWKERIVKPDFAKLIILTKNRGFGGACNAGAFYALGKYLVFLNADTKVTEGWLKNLLEPFKDPNVGIVGNLQIKEGGEWDGTIDSAGSEWSWDKMQFEHIGRHIYKHQELKKPFQYSNSPLDILTLREVEMITGCCFAIPKDLFTNIGGFNINYKVAYWEDSELCMAVRDSGKKIIFQPKSIIYHKLSQSNAANHPYYEWNKFYFINKWIRSKRIDKFVEEPRPMSLGDIKYILLKRKEAYGDVLVASATASALKIKYPDAEISFLTDCKEVLKDNRYIDKLPEENEILAKDYDLYFNFDLEYERRPNSNILESFANLAGVPIGDCEIYIKRKPTKIPKNKYIVFHPGRTNWAGRDWDEKKFNQLAQEVKKLGFDIVCTGKKNDRGVECDLDLRGKTNINELAYIIFHSSLFVGIDSLAMHIAQATKTPGVCFFGSIDPKTRIFRDNMYPVKAKNLSCLGCHHRQMPPVTTLEICGVGTLDCEKMVSVEMMLEKIKDALRLS